MQNLAQFWMTSNFSSKCLWKRHGYSKSDMYIIDHGFFRIPFGEKVKW